MAFAIIAAAGSGQRLGDRRPKFEIPILGKPMVEYSLAAFQQADVIEAIALVIPAERVGDWTASALREAGFDKVRHVVAGGATRQQSVMLGLDALGVTSGVVAVHDAARPMVRPGDVSEACAIPDGLAGLIPAVPITDTIKETDGKLITGTLDRTRLVAVQTPQCFDVAVLRTAHEKAARDRFASTDDAALVERIGGRLGLVEGSNENIKVTYAPDLLLAEAILRGRECR
jgi:2-C-methyl-D-erythritol 4-phosphate cytidylyltransferase